jgi:deoxyribodipyrimidine photo-lyase
VAGGRAAARGRWLDFLERRLDDYAGTRDRADLDGTSRMSVHLKWGEVHPRTMLADLARHPSAGGESATLYVTQLAWREFYADVLWRSPDSARDYLRPEFADMEYHEPGRRFTAWRDGRTGYPVVDAGMRQLRSEGWMHNRIRMVVASFLVKDLHIELRQVDERSIHEPWTLPGGPPCGYPAPIVDHDHERRESLRRLDLLCKVATPRWTQLAESGQTGRLRP